MLLAETKRVTKRGKITLQIHTHRGTMAVPSPIDSRLTESFFGQSLWSRPAVQSPTVFVRGNQTKAGERIPGRSSVVVDGAAHSSQID